jgi:hypothetical protein
MDSQLLSFYIPRVNALFSKTEIKNIIEDRFNACNVKRIDFVSILNPDKTVNPAYRTVFIHTLFHTFFLRNSPSSTALYNATYVAEAAYKLCLDVKNDKYWLLLKNKYPVPETDLNLSQVVENARLLEERVAKQEEIIEYQATKIEKIENVVYQLLGGLFNHVTQDNFLQQHINSLLDNNEVCWSPTNDTTKSKWSHYPTTRQGDDSEMRIQELEKDLKQVKRFVVFHNEPKFSDEDSSDEEEDDDDDISPHPSMPELEEIYSNDDTSSNSYSMPELTSNDTNDNNSIGSSSTHSSMPRLECINNSDSDASREKRIRYSAEICDNI